MSAKIWTALTRKKRNDQSEETKLARVLNLFDLTALGVGSTLGLGVYVLAGSVAYNTAGPAVVISFLIAAIASAFAGLCYAEFAARVPKAGSAYVYSYVSIGEFVAFTIGWNLVLEYVIGTSSVARGLTGYFDTLIGDKIIPFLSKNMPIDINFLADYPDFFSFVLVLVLSAVLASGVKESTLLNNIFTVVNLTTIVIVLVAGGINADPKNWAIDKEDVPEGEGNGGFAPYGFAGIMAGAGFVGFDCVATTGEEAINPKRNIPLAIVISLIIIFLGYFGISTVLTMCLPYFLQKPSAPFPYLFGPEQLDMPAIRWIVSIGAVFALCTSLLGAMFPLPRILYAMGNDGLIYKIMKKVNSRTKTPLIATMLAGLLAAFMALIFDLDQLIDMMSIGTLMAYTIVAVCVLVLYYEVIDANDEIQIPLTQQLFSFKSGPKLPTKVTSSITKVCICVYSLLTCALCGILKFDFNAVVITLLVVVLVLMTMTIFVIAKQPADLSLDLTFRVPFVPYLPCLSIFMNIYLMFQLDGPTWIRFFVWLIVGYVIYFTYGIRKSTEGKLLKEEKKNIESEKE